MRKQLHLKGQNKVLNFILQMENVEDACVIENQEGFLRVSAQSVNGVLYAARDFDKLYFVNTTHPGQYPDFLKEYE